MKDKYLTPEIHTNYSIGFDGLEFVIGIDIKNVAYDLQISYDWETISTIVAMLYGTAYELVIAPVPFPSPMPVTIF